MARWSSAPRARPHRLAPASTRRPPRRTSSPPGRKLVRRRGASLKAGPPEIPRAGDPALGAIESPERPTTPRAWTSRRRAARSHALPGSRQGARRAPARPASCRLDRPGRRWRRHSPAGPGPAHPVAAPPIRRVDAKLRSRHAPCPGPSPQGPRRRAASSLRALARPRSAPAGASPSPDPGAPVHNAALSATPRHPLPRFLRTLLPRSRSGAHSCSQSFTAWCTRPLPPL